MQYPLFPRTCVNAPLRVWSGVSVRKRMSGEWSSSMLTMSEREGLFAPAFCAFIVRRVRFVSVGGVTASVCTCLVVPWAPGGMVGVSVNLGLAEGEASLGSLPCWINVPCGEVSCPYVKGNVSSFGCGEPGGE